MNEPPNPAGELIASHSRQFAENQYVYPVLSRRSGGISLGVNLNRDKACNFDCIYCQVDRSERGGREAVDRERLVAELEALIDRVLSGRLFQEGRFRQTPPEGRRLRDIALSGDGEPTASPDFEAVVRAVADVRRRQQLDGVKLVLITNASLFHQDRVRRGLEILDKNHGEIWAKLDCGTETYYRRLARSSIPFSRVLANLRDAARVRPIVIQSLFLRVGGHPPPGEEVEAYCQRLREITAAGGRVKCVQVYTIARRPAEPWVSPLEPAEIEALASRVRHRTGLAVEAYPSLPTQAPPDP